MQILNKPRKIHIVTGVHNGVKYYWAKCTTDNRRKLILSNKGIFQNVFENQGMKAYVSESIENVVRIIRDNYGRVRFKVL